MKRIYETPNAFILQVDQIDCLTASGLTVYDGGVMDFNNTNSGYIDGGKW